MYACSLDMFLWSIFKFVSPKLNVFSNILIQALVVT
jgi:hypothetical protein